MKRDPRFAELDAALIAAGERVHAPAAAQRRRKWRSVAETIALRRKRRLDAVQRRRKYLRETGRLEQMRAEGLS